MLQINYREKLLTEVLPKRTPLRVGRETLLEFTETFVGMANEFLLHALGIETPDYLSASNAHVRTYDKLCKEGLISAQEAGQRLEADMQVCKALANEVAQARKAQIAAEVAAAPLTQLDNSRSSPPQRDTGRDGGMGGR